MAVKRFGIRDQLYEQPDFRIIVDEKGVWRISQVYECPMDAVLRLAPKPFSAHSQFPFAQLNTMSITRAEGDMAQLVCEYVGLGASEISGAQQSEVVYELIGGSTEDPIETHPRYKDISEEELEIIRYHFANPDKSGTGPTGLTPLAAELFGKKQKGIESYIVSSLTFRKSWSQKTPPTGFGGVGAKDVPDGPAPTLEGDQDWLLIDASWRRVGGVYEVNQEWRASGPSGWDTQIYGS